jgi:hypothetical protein
METDPVPLSDMNGGVAPLAQLAGAIGAVGTAAHADRPPAGGCTWRCLTNPHPILRPHARSGWCCLTARPQRSAVNGVRRAPSPRPGRGHARRWPALAADQSRAAPSFAAFGQDAAAETADENGGRVA